jgi:3-oxoacyl-(acyl-carrier-protein) synthase
MSESCRKIVVTGIAAVTPFGVGVGPLWNGVSRGLVVGDGAAMIVLESQESAERRGVVPLARVLGYGGRKHLVRFAMSNSFAFGGNNACILLGRDE